MAWRRGKGFCKKPKRMPYGFVGHERFCTPHDSCDTYAVNNTAVRQKLKRELEKEPREPEYDPREYVPDEEESND